MTVSIETEVPRKGSSTSFVAQVAEVEVDPETGKIKLHKFVSAHDVGTIINPLGHQGQIDGEAIMAIGSGLMEELIHDQGKVTTTNSRRVQDSEYRRYPEIQDRLGKGKERARPLRGQGYRRACQRQPTRRHRQRGARRRRSAAVRYTGHRGEGVQRDSRQALSEQSEIIKRNQRRAAKDFTERTQRENMR